MMWRPGRPLAGAVTVLRLDPAALARQRRLNHLQSLLIFLGLALLAGATGLVVAGPEGLFTAAAAATFFLLFNPAPGDMFFDKAYGAVPLSRRQAPELVALMEELARRAKLPVPPALHLIPSYSLQALAAGNRKGPAIAVTLGLLQALPPRELAAVLAHEVAHIRHDDISVMRLAAAAASLARIMAAIGLVLLCLWLPASWTLGQAPSPIGILLLMSAPLLGDLLILSLSRQREFLADAGAVELTGDPVALSSALARLQQMQGDDWERMIRRGGPSWLRWFRTHPGIEQRIRHLAGTVAPVRVPLPGPGEAGADQGMPWDLGGRNRAQTLARRWML